MNPNNRSRARRAPHRAGGFVMLEVLVAGLIFSIGVLGLVGLQATMTKAQTVGQFRGEAMFLANELVGHLWADSPANRANYTTAGCAAHPRCNDWLTKVGRMLPGGTTVLDMNIVTGVATISISWTTSEGTQTFSTTTAVMS